MKINKLFHWLYAFLMFLPVLALAPSLFYFAFNQQSQNYTDVQVNETYEYQTNEVSAYDDLVIGNIYKLTMPSLSQSDYFEEECLIYGTSKKIYLDFQNTFSSYEEYLDFNFQFSGSNYDEASNVLIRNHDSIQFFNCDDATFNYYLYFIYSEEIEIDSMTNYSKFLSASDYLGEKMVDVVRSEQSPMNIFYTAVNYVYDMPVFSWAKTSFLALPITYVTGLFGMASTNVVNYYLSYWLAISIVYLVFDLVMYVPLLVHRWIDKGMIE